VCERQDELQQLRAERAEQCRALRTRFVHSASASSQNAHHNGPAPGCKSACNAYHVGYVQGSQKPLAHLTRRLDSENNQLEQVCASTRASNLIEAETQKLAHEKLLLLGPDQLRAVQAHSLRLSRAQQLLVTLKVCH
jgi:hypothetical protein